MAKERKTGYGRGKYPDGAHPISAKGAKRKKNWYDHDELFDSSVEMFQRNTRGTFYKGAALYKIRELLSPYSEEVRGYRIVCTAPNQMGHKPFSNDPAPSFDKPWLIVSYGDYEDMEQAESRIPAIEKDMKRRGWHPLQHFQLTPEERHAEARTAMREEMAKAKKDEVSTLLPPTDFPTT